MRVRWRHGREAMPIVRLIGGIVAVLAAMAMLGVSAESQTPFVGAFLPSGDQRALLSGAMMIGAQGSVALSPRTAIVVAYGWSASEDKLLSALPRVDLFQFDLGVEGHLRDFTPVAALSTRPYAMLGGGARTYVFRNDPAETNETNPLGYGALGVDVRVTGARIGLRFEARNNITGFKGLRGELRDRATRSDWQFTAAMTFGG